MPKLIYYHFRLLQPCTIYLILLNVVIIFPQFQVNTWGLLCDECRNGTFNKDVANPSGCMECDCMGVTSNCHSTKWTLQNVTLPLVNGSPNYTSAFVLVAEDGTLLSNDVIMTTVNSTYVIQAILGDFTTAYWLTTAISGDLVAMYSGYITFTVYYTSADNLTLLMVDAQVIVLGRNGSRLNVAIAGVVPDQTTTIAVTLTEKTVTQGGRKMSRSELLFALTDVHGVMLPASFSQHSHVTR